MSAHDLLNDYLIDLGDGYAHGYSLDDVRMLVVCLNCGNMVNPLFSRRHRQRCEQRALDLDPFKPGDGLPE